MSKRVDAINGAVDSCSDVFEHFVATWAVPVADGVVAVLAANNMATTLGFPLSVSVMAGIALEGVGIVSSKAALECHYYNQVRGSKPPVLEALAWVVAGIQFGVGFALILVNAVMIERMVLGLLAIGVLSTTGTLAHMLRDDVRAREKSPSPQATPQAQALVAETTISNAPEVAESTQAVRQASARERVLAFYIANPTASQIEAASACELSRQRVGQLLAELEREGAISRNGHVEVLGASTGGR